MAAASGHLSSSVVAGPAVCLAPTATGPHAGLAPPTTVFPPTLATAPCTPALGVPCYPWMPVFPPQQQQQPSQIPAQQQQLLAQTRQLAIAPAPVPASKDHSNPTGSSKTDYHQSNAATNAGTVNAVWQRPLAIGAATVYAPVLAPVSAAPVAATGIPLQSQQQQQQPQTLLQMSFLSALQAQSHVASPQQPQQQQGSVEPQGTLPHQPLRSTVPQQSTATFANTNHPFQQQQLHQMQQTMIVATAASGSQPKGHEVSSSAPNVNSGAAVPFQQGAMHNHNVHSVGQTNGSSAIVAASTVPKAASQLEPDPMKDVHGEIPDFLSGFDNVALSMNPPASIAAAAATTTTLGAPKQFYMHQQVVADGSSTMHPHELYTPTFTSRSFDDFHRLLGKDLTQLDGGAHNHASTHSGPAEADRNSQSKAYSSFPAGSYTSTLSGNLSVSNVTPPGKRDMNPEATRSADSDAMPLFSAESYALFAQESARAASQHAAYLPNAYIQTPEGKKERAASFDLENMFKIVSEHVVVGEHHHQNVMPPVPASQSFNLSFQPSNFNDNVPWSAGSAPVPRPDSAWCSANTTLSEGVSSTSFPGAHSSTAWASQLYDGDQRVRSFALNHNNHVVSASEPATSSNESEESAIGSSRSSRDRGSSIDSGDDDGNTSSSNECDSESASNYSDTSESHRIRNKTQLQNQQSPLRKRLRTASSLSSSGT